MRKEVSVWFLHWRLSATAADCICARPRFLSGRCPSSPCEVTLRVGERLFNGKSILGLMTAGVRQSAQVEIRCSGEGEREALKAALEAITSGLGEWPEQ